MSLSNAHHVKNICVIIATQNVVIMLAHSVDKKMFYFRSRNNNNKVVLQMLTENNSIKRNRNILVWLMIMMHSLDILKSDQIIDYLINIRDH